MTTVIHVVNNEHNKLTTVTHFANIGHHKLTTITLFVNNGHNKLTTVTHFANIGHHKFTTVTHFVNLDCPCLPALSLTGRVTAMWSTGRMVTDFYQISGRQPEMGPALCFAAPPAQASRQAESGRLARSDPNYMCTAHAVIVMSDCKDKPAWTDCICMMPGSMPDCTCIARWNLQ